MKTIHAHPLRADSKHDVRQRQLPRRAFALLAAGALFSAVGHASEGSSPQEELQAARLLATTLYARQATTREWQQMERVYRQLAEKYPRDAAVRNAHAEWLWDMGEPERSVELWLAAEKLDPKNATVLDHLGGSFLAAGQVRKSAGYYARAAACAPENAAYHHNYANVAFMFRHELLDATRPDADAVLRLALHHFGEAARLAPLNPEFARAYAETFYILPAPDWRAALAAWQHFWKISPQKDFGLLNLARVHMKLGDKPAARAALAQVSGIEYRGLKARLAERLDTE